MIPKKEIITLLEIDWTSFVVALVLLLCIVVIVLKNIDSLKERFGIKTKRDIEHELLIQTSKNLSALQEQHKNDMADFKRSQTENVNQSIKHDERIRNELEQFMSEMKETITTINNQMQTYSNNRVRDREQSLQIQKELTDSIKTIADGGKRREEQMDAVMTGNRELLGAEIDRRFEKYIELHGIPADEYDEFVSLHKAYKGCKGNHNRDTKYEYVVSNLPVLPVESKIKRSDNN